MGIITKNFKVLIILIFSLFWTNNLKANTSSDFINKITTEVSTILSSSEDDKLKISKLIQIGKESVDIDGLAFYTLGKHRKSLDDNQKSEFVKIFNDYFLKSFSSRLVEYKDAKIVVISEEVKNEKYTIVKSKLLATSKRPEVAIDWRVYTIDPEKPLIRDLIIEGLSLARTQREEFNSIIVNNSGDVNALFSNLREFINK
jgi:phospholipid transport system substrate-binding protein